MVVNNPQLTQAVTAMLSNDGGQGGVGGLTAKFQQADLVDVVGSWVGGGQNQSVSGEQLTDVLSADTKAELAEMLGSSQGNAAAQLSDMLPGLIDKLTPQVQAPARGLGSAVNLLGLLVGLLQKR